MKTRVALQIMLDALPFLLLLFPLIFGILDYEESLSIPGWVDAAAYVSLIVTMFGGGAVLFPLGIWLRSRATVAFECYPACKAVSFIFRVLSFIPAAVSLGLVIGIAVTKLSA